MVKKPDLDENTLRIAERLLRMPPKPHEAMKLGKKPKAKRAASPTKANKPKRQ